MKIISPKEKFNRMIQVRNLLIGLVVFLIIILFFLFLNTVNANKINWGLKIAGISIGGFYPQEAQKKLETASQQFLQKDFFLNHQESYWQVTPEKLGAEIDVPLTIKLAYEKTHQSKKFLNNIFWQVFSLFGYNLKPVWQIDEEKLENFFQKNLSSIHQPAQNANLVYDKKRDDFIIAPSKKGVIIDKNKFKKDLVKNINNFQQKEIQLSLIEDQPEVLESETQKAKERARFILRNAPLKLTIIEDKQKGEIDKINKETLLEMLDFKPILDQNNPDNKILGVRFKQEKIKEYLITLAPLVNREPVNAQLTIKDNRVIAFALSQEGIRLEIENNILVLSQGILNPPPGGEIELKIDRIQPKITTESIKNLGITALLSTGSSNFAGSPSSRIHNIKIGAAKFNGVLIKPKEEFSFNAILGEIGPEQGYEPELVIKRDKTIPEYGGGLCQVSTTAFRVAINAGLKITERFAHAFPVKYYNPQGFDATIYPPSPDLKFINNTPNYILIQTKIVGQDLFFEFYGTNDGREVKIDGPSQYDIKEDDSMKAKLTQKVYDKNGNLIIEKTFYSNYKSPDLYPIERNPLE